MKVTIPACKRHLGLLKMTVEISDSCPKCGGPRGKRVIKGLVLDGKHEMWVDAWKNPCGHVDEYKDVRREADKIEAESK